MWPGARSEAARPLGLDGRLSLLRLDAVLPLSAGGLVAMRCLEMSSDAT